MTTRSLLALLGVVVACAVDRNAPTAPTWDDDIAPIVAAKCAGCHSGASAAAGWRVDRYLDAIACVTPSNAPATLPASSSAPIVQALDTTPHVGLLDPSERDTILAWVAAGAAAFATAVHTPDIIDPRAPAFHGTTLRNARWRPMLDPTDASACGRCHDGAPSRPTSVTMAAPGAPSCTTCHDQPGGVLSCGTCHGTTTHAYPPRDACFFPNDPSGGAHAAHVEASTTHASLACTTCHPAVGNPVIGGLHGDGALEIAFDAARVFPEMSWDPTTKACAVSCHDRGGSRAKPSWNDTTPMGCNDCHTSPPANHYVGACNRCHAEANATGTALSGGPLHMNGRIDLGDGSGKCGACHGSGDDPYPTDAVHHAHASPTISAPVACDNCHVVPTSIHAPGHFGSTASVVFANHALDRGASPTWDGVSCHDVACHGAKLADPPAAPAWSDASGKESACGACHGVPPTNHTTSLDCNRSTCHGAETTSPPTITITPSGTALHINGAIDVVP